MIHVRLTSDLSIDFNTREMRWSFTDCTHNKHLVADVLGRSEVDKAGPVYLIRLEDHTQEQVFDVGKILVTAARVKEPTSKFKSRDIRFTEKMATPTTTTTANVITQRETPPNDVVPSSQQNGEERTIQISSDPPTEAMNDEREVGGASQSLAPPSDVHTVPPSLVTHGTSPPPSTVSPSQTTPQLQSDSSSPPRLPTPSPLVTGSPNSQRSTSALQTEGGLDSVPNSDTTPNDSGTDMFLPTDDSRDSIPPQDIPDLNSIPHSKDPPTSSDSGVSPHSIPLTKESQTGTKPGPLQLDEVEGVLRNAGVANDDKDQAGEDEVVEAVENIHPSVKIGVRLEVEIVTELSAEGSFWCQLVLSSEIGASYDRLQETLQVGAGRGDNEAFTPVFYHEGELCTARFSEDEDWYRARIERVCPGAPLMTFTVRYIDFGNSEERQQHELIPLGSKFKLLPPRAIHCNIATTDHVTFTREECEKFDDVTTTEGLSIEVLAVKEEFRQPVSVRLFKTHTNNPPVEVMELMFTAGKPAVKPVPRRQWSSSTDLETQTIGHVADWASHMEDQPEDSVFLTLPGHESSRETTPLAREATPTNDITSSSQREVTTNQRADSNLLREPKETRLTTRKEVRLRETTPTMPTETTPNIRREAMSRETTPTVQRKTTPIIQQNTTFRQQTASPVATVTSARSVTPQRETTPTHQEATPTQWAPLRSSNFLQRVPPSSRDSSRPRQARLDLSRAKHSIMSSLGGAKTVPRPLRHDDSEGSPNLRRTRHSRQDHANPHGKLYVKCPTEDMSDSKIKELFGRYGDVLDLDPHTTDSSIVYVTMDVKGAEEVVANLNGYQTSPGHRLVVEKYRARSPSPPPQPPAAASALADLAGVDHVKLFVKNMSADHNPANLRTVFSRYGQVLKMVSDPKRKNVTYIFMDAEGGTKAVNNLHGKAISKNGKPLVVEPSYDPRNR
ncbi:Tudor domain-containing protein 1 [Geodia barretti]|nr:Tudor domain-containing protein 1 [Geodia barretti]